MSGKYDIGKSDIDKEITALAKRFSEPGNFEYVRQILTTAVKFYFDGTNQADLKLINTSLKELRHAFRVFAPHRDIRKVVIWGSSRIAENSAEYKLAMDFAKKISESGFFVMTGAGGGVMEAGNRGAGRNGFGINIHLPMEQGANPYVKDKRLLSFHYFFTRKLIFIKESDATVLFPGGYGTLDEAFEILTLAQTGKMMPRPIILLEPRLGTYWKNWLKFVKKEMGRKKFISKCDIELFSVLHSAKDAVEEVKNFYSVYHSIRYVGQLTVIRLTKELSFGSIRQLNRKFRDILTGGTIELSGPRPEEVEDKDHVHLPRLCLKYNRRDFGRLYEMVREINCLD